MTRAQKIRWFSYLPHGTAIGLIDKDEFKAGIGYGVYLIDWIPVYILTGALFLLLGAGEINGARAVRVDQGNQPPHDNPFSRN